MAELKQGSTAGGLTIATENWVASQGYLTSQTDSQTLSWNGTNGVLTISGGNSVDLDGRYLQTVAWNDITGKPSSFTPSAHSHGIGDVSGLQDAIDAKLDLSTNPIKNASVSNDTITFTRIDNTTFTVTTSDANTWRGIHDTPVDGATAVSISSNWAFDNVKTAVPANAVFTDTKDWASITGKPSTFAPSAHTHAIDAVEGLQDALDAKQPAGSYAAASHSHSYLPLSGGTLTGGLTIGGSESRGTYTTASQYHTGADNIVLKGNSVGISGIFFESEKDGTNINHPSDFGFIQYHAYGTSTSGESNELIVGVSNDSDDNVIINAPNVNGFKFRTGATETDYTVYHSGNLTLATLGYTGATNANYITNNNQLANGANYITGVSWSEITSKPSSFTAAAHTHPISDVDGLQTALDNKQAAGSYAASSHTHTFASITSKPTTIAGYGITDAFNGAYSSLTGIPQSFAPSAHTHAISEVDGLQGALDAKSDSTHNHSGVYLPIAGTAANSNKLDNLDSTDFYRAVSTATGTGAGSQWVTVATAGSGRYSGEIYVTDGESSDHSFIRIHWMRSYADSNFSVLNCGGHANRITGVRVLYETSDNTYGGKMLQVYVTATSSYTSTVHKEGKTQHFSTPTAIVTSYSGNGIPTGYAVHGNELTGLDQVSLAAEEGIRVGGTIYVNGQGNSSEWNTAYSWGNHASLYDSAGSAAAVNNRIDNDVMPVLATLNNTNWDNAYNNHITGIAVTGTTTKTITLTQKDGGTISAQFTDLSGAGGDGNDFITAGTWDGGSETLTLSVSNQPDVVIQLTDTMRDTNTTYTVGDGGLTQKNFTSTLKTKLDGIAAGAEVNVQSDWNATTGDAFIKNKPTLGTAAAAAVGDFATAAQGALADSALQSLPAHTHGIAEVDGLQTALDGKVDDSQVLTNVPAGAVFTDTVYVHPTTAGNKHIPSGGSAGQFLKYSSSGTAVWATPSYTTSLAFSSITGKPTTLAGYGITDAASSSHTHTPSQVGLGNLSNSGNNLAGAFTATGDITAFSDIRVKENIQTIPNALESVCMMRGVTYNKIGEQKESVGVIAQEIKEVLPQVVHENEDGMLSVAYGNITGVLIEAIKEQQKQIEELKSIIDGFTK